MIINSNNQTRTQNPIDQSFAFSNNFTNNDINDDEEDYKLESHFQQNNFLQQPNFQQPIQKTNNNK